MAAPGAGCRVTPRPRTLPPDAGRLRRAWFAVVRDRRCRAASLLVALGAGLAASAIFVTALQAQGVFLLDGLFRQNGALNVAVLSRLGELLIVPAVLGLATGLVTWGVWRTTVSQHGRQLQDHATRIQGLETAKADKELMRDGFERLREVLRLELQHVQAAAHATAEQIKLLREEAREARTPARRRSR